MNVTTAFKLDEIQRIEAEYNGESFWFDVLINRTRTPRFFQQLTDSDNGKLGELVAALCDVVKGWSITGADERQWPITRNDLEVLPFPFLRVMANEIVESWTRKEGK
jgi:hypothetical protein